MPYRLTIKPPVLFVSWNGFTASELRDVTDRLAEMRRASGRPVAYLSRIPAGNYVFTESDQAVLLRFLQTILASCATIHHVIEGDGFVKSARLAIVTNLALATTRPRDLHTHASLADAVRVVKELYAVRLRRREQRVRQPTRARVGRFPRRRADRRRAPTPTAKRVT